MSFEPTDSNPKACELCELDFAVVGPLCVSCAIRAAVDNDEMQRAFDLAEDYGLETSVVTTAIKARDEYSARIAALPQPRPGQCKRCHIELTEHTKGQWPATGCCIDCEFKALTDAITAAANDNDKVAL